MGSVLSLALQGTSFFLFHLLVAPLIGMDVLIQMTLVIRLMRVICSLVVDEGKIDGSTIVFGRSKAELLCNPECSFYIWGRECYGTKIKNSTGTMLP